MSSLNLRARLEEHRHEERQLAWRGRFAEYFDLALANPRLAQLSHARIYNMIVDAGVTTDERGVTTYKFFEDDIFGIEKPIEQLVDYFRSAAQRLEVRKRILLLMGPVGGGKSTLVALLKKGLERHTRTEAGALYAIARCPMHEEPLHLLPETIRTEVYREHGLYVEGDLCPHCHYWLGQDGSPQHPWGPDFKAGHIEDVPIVRIVFSEKNRCGIGTFQPSDPKCVTGDTILLTDRGMLRFDEIQREVGAAADRFVPLDLAVEGRNGKERTSHFYNGGVKPTRRITTRLGYEVEGSLVHPVLVLRDGKEQWVRLGDLATGDYVGLRRNPRLFGEHTTLPYVAYTGPKSRGQNARLTLPTEIDARLARLLGYIVAEGSLTDTALWITNGNRRVLDDIHELCRDLFSIEAREYPKSDGSCCSISISSLELVHWLTTVCGITRGAANKRVPLPVMAAPRPIVLAFLEGLAWGDGTISARKALGSNRFKIATASEELGRQLQVILLNLGIISARYRETIQGRFTAWSVVVTGDAVVDLVTLIPSLREKCTDGAVALVAKRGSTNVEGIPQLHGVIRAVIADARAAQPQALPRADRYASTANWSRRPTRAVLARFIDEAETAIGQTTPDTATLRDHLDPARVWLPVERITEGEAQVYDLTVPGTHSFCANGFINHNSQDVSELTGGIDFATIGEVGSESDPRAYRFDGELNIANRGLVEFVEMLKCLRGDSLLFTAQGIRPLASFAEAEHPVGESRPVAVKLASATGVEETAQLFHAGIKPTKRVTTRRGFLQEGAHEHRVLAVNGEGVQVWKRHDELVVGDWLVLQRGQNLWGEDVPIAWRCIRQARNQPIRVPERMTPELARWLGYMTAEGDIQRNGTVRFACHEEELRRDFAALTQELFGIAPRAYPGVVQFNSVQVLDLVEHLGFRSGAYQKAIPWSVLQSSRTCMLEFLAGYFAGDGSVNLRGRLFWATTSTTLAMQLQLALLNLGVVSRRVQTVQRAGDFVGTYWTVAVSGTDADLLAGQMRLLPIRKRLAYEQRAAQQSRSGRADIIPNTAGYWQAISDELQLVTRARARAAGESLSRSRTGVHQVLGSEYTNLHMLRTGRNSCTREQALQVLDKLSGWVEPPPGLSALLNPTQFYDQVVTIENGEADCWDFHVPGSNTFIANGIVNHNCDERFLYVLLTLSQEQNIKTGRFAMIYADETIVSHTNEHEYTAFTGNKKSEALQDRIILVKVPYNLRVNDEVRIYEKLLKQSALTGVHVAPHTLDTAATFAVLTRLEESKKAGMSLMKKLKLYNGEAVEDYADKDLKELREETQREGLDGISPRYVINRLSSALVKQDVTCINAIDALRALRDGLDQHTSITKEQREHYLNFISEARKEYDERAKKEVQRAFVYSYEESAKTLLNNYLDNVEAFCNKQKVNDPLTGEPVDPDERLMRSIEEQIGVTDSGKRAFREEILIRISSLARRGQTFTYDSHERLKEAIEKKLFADMKDVVKITTSTKTPDADQLRRINEVVDRLVRDQGYCPTCAANLLTYVGALLQR